MRWIAVVLAAFVLGACADWNTGQASSVIDAHVVRVVSEGTRAPGQPGLPGQPFQTVEIELDGSLYRGDHVTLEWGGRVALNANGLLAPGDRVLVSQHRGDNDAREYAIEDVVRLPSLLPFVAALVVALVAVARWKGLASLAGLAGSIAVFLLAIVPAVQRGEDPLAATLAGALAVLVIAVFVVHGFNRKSLAALVGTTACLLVVVALAYFGGAMPLVVLLSLGNLPISLSANSETIVGSMVAVLIASIGLVLCVPITTAIAVALVDRRRPGA
jgi:uncharacterized membrane protein